jgi:hypothetical protein
MGGCGAALSLTVWTRVQLSCKLRMVAHSQRHARACARETRRRAVEGRHRGLILLRDQPDQSLKSAHLVGHLTPRGPRRTANRQVLNGTVSAGARLPWEALAKQTRCFAVRAAEGRSHQAQTVSVAVIPNLLERAFNVGIPVVLGRFAVRPPQSQNAFSTVLPSGGRYGCASSFPVVDPFCRPGMSHPGAVCGVRAAIVGRCRSRSGEDLRKAALRARNVWRQRPDLPDVSQRRNGHGVTRRRGGAFCGESQRSTLSR